VRINETNIGNQYGFGLFAATGIFSWNFTGNGFFEGTNPFSVIEQLGGRHLIFAISKVALLVKIILKVEKVS
jgi:hypothetical protein